MHTLSASVILLKQNEEQSEASHHKASAPWPMSIHMREIITDTTDLRPHQLVAALRTTIKRFSYALVPQLVRTKCFNDPAPATNLTSTSWMNGIRGLASFAVFNEHYVYNFTDTLLRGYGTRPGDRWIHQLPPFELFNDGVCGVMIFFTVAGYVCSYKPLEAMTTGDSSTLFKSLPTSVFRRWFRIYLPVICSTFCISTLAYVGAYEPSRPYFQPKDVRTRIFPGPGTEPQPARAATLYAQLAHWTSQVLEICNFWTELPRNPPIDFHLWTIVYEYRASLQLYTALVALAACKTWARILFLVFLAYTHAFHFGHYEMLCFYGGAVLAQFDVLRRQHQIPTTERQSERPETQHGRRHRLVRPFLYALALYLMSVPIRGYKYPAPLYAHTVNPLLPVRAYGRGLAPRFAKQVGVLLLLHLLTTTPSSLRSRRSLWHRLLTSDVAVYLGKIMFGFFITHGMVLHVFGYALPHLVWRGMGMGDVLRGDDVFKGMGLGTYLVGLGVGYVLSLGVALWVADVWTREVEGRCVRLTKVVEGFVLR